MLCTLRDGVDCALDAYWSSFGVDWTLLCGGGKRRWAGSYLYYHWLTGLVDKVGALQAILSSSAEEGLAIRNCYQNVELSKMKAMQCFPDEGGFSRVELVQTSNEHL